MQIVRLPATGTSAKFSVKAKGGSFTIALSQTLKNDVWQLNGNDAELAAASELAEAIVSRHNPKLPFLNVYVFAPHNTEPTLGAAIKLIRKYGYGAS